MLRIGTGTGPSIPRGPSRPGQTGEEPAESREEIPWEFKIGMQNVRFIRYRSNVPSRVTRRSDRVSAARFRRGLLVRDVFWIALRARVCVCHSIGMRLIRFHQPTRPAGHPNRGSAGSATEKCRILPIGTTGRRHVSAIRPVERLPDAASRSERHLKRMGKHTTEHERNGRVRTWSTVDPGYNRQPKETTMKMARDRSIWIYKTAGATARRRNVGSLSRRIHNGCFFIS